MAHKLLNHFVYFNNRMIKEMLISLYRDFIQYPIRQKFLHEVDVEKKIIKPPFYLFIFITCTPDMFI
jgi:hypothetical protein